MLALYYQKKTWHNGSETGSMTDNTRLRPQFVACYSPQQRKCFCLSANIPCFQGVIVCVIGKQQLSLSGREASCMTAISHKNIGLFATGIKFLKANFVLYPSLICPSLFIFSSLPTEHYKWNNDFIVFRYNIYVHTHTSNIDQTRYKITAWEETQLHTYCNREW